jgi:hypothetical protein
LITGQPLLQEIDFELPFGGAVFRHVRTYSENVSALIADDDVSGDAASDNPDARFWD